MATRKRGKKLPHWIYQDAKTGKLYGDFRAHGGKRESLNTRDVQVAILRYQEREREIVDPNYETARQATLGGIVQAFLRPIDRDGNPNTLKYYTQKTGNLLAFWGADFPIRKFTYAEVERYLDERAKQGASQYTRYHEYGALKRVLKLAKKRKEFAGDLSEIMDHGVTSGYEARELFLEPEELAAVLDALPRHRAAHVAFIVGTGARWSESLKARRAHVDLNGESETTIMTTKRKNQKKAKPRFVPITALARVLVERALRDAPGEDVLFERWSNARRDIIAAYTFTKTGIRPSERWYRPDKKTGKRRIDTEKELKDFERKQLSPNDLRRTFGSWLAQNGVDLHLIAKALGHTTSRMAELVYAKLRPRHVKVLMNKQLGGATLDNESHLLAEPTGGTDIVLTRNE